MSKFIGTLKKVGNFKASKKKDKQNVQQEEVEGDESFSREMTSSNKSYIFPDHDILLVVDIIRNRRQFLNLNKTLIEST